MIKWAEAIEKDSTISEVKKQEPDWITIDWESPILLHSEVWYEITYVKGSNDILGMRNFLVFNVEGKFIGRFARK